MTQNINQHNFDKFSKNSSFHVKFHNILSDLNDEFKQSSGIF